MAVLVVAVSLLVVALVVVVVFGQIVALAGGSGTVRCIPVCDCGALLAAVWLDGGATAATSPVDIDGNRLDSRTAGKAPEPNLTSANWDSRRSVCLLMWRCVSADVVWQRRDAGLLFARP